MLSHTGILGLLFALSYLILDKFRDKLSLKRQQIYNNFADQRIIHNIPNCMDVMSNMIFIFGAVYHYNNYILSSLCFFVALGSSYYHWNPVMSTLFWDRLPMAMIFCYVIADKLNMMLIQKILFIIIGSYTVYYWKRTHDLVPYLTFQLAPMIFFLLYKEYHMIPCIMLYIAAKLFEMVDYQIYIHTNGLVSGHTIKHLIAGLSMFTI